MGKLFEKWLRDGAHSDLKDWQWKRAVALGDRKPATVQYEVTHMGNGSITIKTLVLRTYRSHEDEFIYNPYELNVKLAPGPSGCRLSVPSNIRMLQGNARVTGHKHANLAYDYDPTTERFRDASPSSPGHDEVDLSRLPVQGTYRLNESYISQHNFGSLYAFSSSVGHRNFSADHPASLAGQRPRLN